MLAVFVCLVVGLAGLTVRLFIEPAQGAPARVSAIVMLQGMEDARLNLAVSLAEEHRAPMLVISQGRDGYGGPCPAAIRGVKLICFNPNPPNTRGEAEFASNLARQYHWTSVILVTNREQDTRGRLLMSMCFNGPIYVVTLPLGSLREAAPTIAYEWGALLKALVLYHACLPGLALALASERPRGRTRWRCPP
ncbi:MAG: hypothetical protein JWM19_1502 [Actinomycetia bacterium]|nr:hypothetical protein [Actinomycetes bacterium]